LVLQKIKIVRETSVAVTFMPSALPTPLKAKCNQAVWVMLAMLAIGFHTRAASAFTGHAYSTVQTYTTV
jgi:hypothetical protein